MLVTGLGDPEDWPAAVPYRQRGGQSANGVVHLVDDVQSPEAARPRSKNSNQVQNHSSIYSKMNFASNPNLESQRKPYWSTMNKIKNSIQQKKPLNCLNWVSFSYFFKNRS